MSSAMFGIIYVPIRARRHPSRSTVYPGTFTFSQARVLPPTYGPDSALVT
jgi:hypothetical protein